MSEFSKFGKGFITLESTERTLTYNPRYPYMIKIVTRQIKNKEDIEDYTVYFDNNWLFNNGITDIQVAGFFPQDDHEKRYEGWFDVIHASFNRNTKTYSIYLSHSCNWWELGTMTSATAIIDEMVKAQAWLAQKLGKKS